MFNKLKQFKDLRDQAKKIQKVLSGEIMEMERDGIKIEMDGNMDIKKIHIDVSWLAPEKKSKLEEKICALHNDLKNKVQRKMAEVFRDQGGLGDMKLPF